VRQVHVLNVVARSKELLVAAQLKHATNIMLQQLGPGWFALRRCEALLQGSSVTDRMWLLLLRLHILCYTDCEKRAAPCTHMPCLLAFAGAHLEPLSTCANSRSGPLLHPACSSLQACDKQMHAGTSNLAHRLSLLI
jgi:hypothetical protein